MLDSNVKINFNDANLFFIYLAYVLAQLYTAFSMCGQKDDALHGQCSTVQTLYIFYYYIVLYIYCMLIWGKKKINILWSSIVGFGK